MSDPSSEWREERLARNEASFRLINEHLETDLRQLSGSDEPHRFVCECGSRRCQQAITLTLGEYEAVRARGDHFAVLPGHAFEDAENIVARHERYYVVEKVGVGAAISDLTNPRGDQPAGEDSEG